MSYGTALLTAATPEIIAILMALLHQDTYGFVEDAAAIALLKFGHNNITVQERLNKLPRKLGCRYDGGMAQKHLGMIDSNAARTCRHEIMVV
jgi:hypothetical protein